MNCNQIVEEFEKKRRSLGPRCSTRGWSRWKVIAYKRKMKEIYECTYELQLGEGRSMGNKDTQTQMKE